MSFNKDKDDGKLYEETVLMHLLTTAATKKRKNYWIENIGDIEENPHCRPSVDVLETWNDDEGVHEVGHEVKAEITWAMNLGGYGRYVKPHQKELQPWSGRSDNGLCKGSGNLFIETRSLLSGEPGWYPKMKDALSDGLTRFLWFVLVSDSPVIQEFKNGNVTFPDALESPDWTNNVLLSVPAANFIEIFEAKKSGYRFTRNADNTAEGLLMPIIDLWQQPDTYECEFIDGEGKLKHALFEGLMSHPRTGSKARLYCDESRISELFPTPAKEVSANC